MKSFRKLLAKKSSVAGANYRLIIAERIIFGDTHSNQYPCKFMDFSNRWGNTWLRRVRWILVFVKSRPPRSTDSPSGRVSTRIRGIRPTLGRKYNYRRLSRFHCWGERSTRPRTIGVRDARKRREDGRRRGFHSWPRASRSMPRFSRRPFFPSMDLILRIIRRWFDDFEISPFLENKDEFCFRFVNVRSWRLCLDVFNNECCSMDVKQWTLLRISLKIVS